MPSTVTSPQPESAQNDVPSTVAYTRPGRPSTDRVLIERMKGAANENGSALDAWPPTVSTTGMSAPNVSGRSNSTKCCPPGSAPVSGVRAV